MEKHACIKITYKNKRKAWSQAAKHFTRFGIMAYPYMCKFCQRFHITTHPNCKLKKQKLPKEFIDTFNKWYGSNIL